MLSIQIERISLLRLRMLSIQIERISGISLEVIALFHAPAFFAGDVVRAFFAGDVLAGDVGSLG